MLSGLSLANRDERFWEPDASEVRVRRDNARQHVSFGAGPHHCLGASLARLEASIALDRMIGRFPALALALDGDANRNGRITLRGPARLPCSPAELITAAPVSP
jgi:cytochrome P450